MVKFLQIGVIGLLFLTFGTAIFFLYRADKANDAKQKVVTNITFSENVAPIIYQHCSNCHRPGQAGPFPLLSYSDVAKRSLTVRAVVDKKIMPPWPADPSYSQFCEQNFLSDDEISIIDAWVKAGSLEGDLSKLPPIPDFPTHSLIGTPDLTLPIKPFFVKGDNTDRFLVMKIPFELLQDSFIRAIEFVPGCKYVHHVNGHLICFDDHKKKSVFEGSYVLDTKDETRDDVLMKMQLLNDDGSNPRVELSATNYLPGVFGTIYPEGIGGFFATEKNLVYLNDIHYGPTSEDVLDTSYVNIFLDRKPPVRPTKEIQLGTLGVGDIIPPLVIPPDTIMTFVMRGKILNDISLLTVNPHMHLLGKSFIAYALKPNGDTIPLIRIKNWDFRWQFFYTFKKMLHIPAGSTIEVVAVMDNTINNPNNPNHPPKQVEGRNGSMRTTDEMLQFIMTFLPYQSGDENISLETAVPD